MLIGAHKKTTKQKVGKNMKNALHKLLKMLTFTESTRLTLLFSFHRMLLFSLAWSFPYREPRWCEDNIDFVRSFIIDENKKVFDKFQINVHY